MEELLNEKLSDKAKYDYQLVCRALNHKDEKAKELLFQIFKDRKDTI